MTSRHRRWLAPVLTIIAIVAVLGLIALLTAIKTVPQGEVGFVRGGKAPVVGFDPSNRRIKGDLQTPGLKVTGAWDKMDTYPAHATLRFQDFDTTITTLDGKKVKIEGQVGFRFIGEKDPALALEFAKGLGSRKYDGKRPGDGAGEGWTAFLDQLVNPEINAVFKDAFGRRYCADFEPSCRSIDPRENVPQAQPEKVYAAIAPIVAQQVTAKLGGAYLTDFRVRVRRISLPSEVQGNIDRVTSEQARTQAADQAVKTARKEAEAITVKGKALRSNRSLIALEVAKECRGGDQCTVIVDGSGGGVTPSVNAKP